MSSVIFICDIVFAGDYILWAQHMPCIMEVILWDSVMVVSAGPLLVLGQALLGFPGQGFHVAQVVRDLGTPMQPRPDTLASL